MQPPTEVQRKLEVLQKLLSTYSIYARSLMSMTCMRILRVYWDRLIIGNVSRQALAQDSTASILEEALMLGLKIRSSQKIIDRERQLKLIL